MADANPNAAVELADYLRDEFDPTLETRAEEIISWGWHRINIRPERFKSYPFASYQYGVTQPVTSPLAQAGTPQ